MKVKDFIKELEKENQELELFFGGLDLYRTRQVGNHIHVEFNQPVYLNQEGLVVVENH